MTIAPILIVSGPPGAGRTTVARQLADGCEQSVHLQTDFFYASIRRGYIAPRKAEAVRQNETAVRAAASAVSPYALAGYATIVDGVMLPWALEIYRQQLAGNGLVALCAVLLPDVDEVVRRGLNRSEDHGLDETAYRELHRQFVAAFEGGAEPIFREPASALETTNAVRSALKL